MFDSSFRYGVTSFRCGVALFRHTNSPGLLVVFRGRLGELSVRLVVLRARHIRLSFCRFVVSLWHFMVSMWRFIVSTRRHIKAIIRLKLHEVLLGSIHQIHEVFIRYVTEDSYIDLRLNIEFALNRVRSFP